MADLTERFLRSIHCPSLEYSDFKVLEAKQVNGVCHISIWKKTYWTTEELFPFLNALTTIPYAYSLSFTYETRMEEGELAHFLEDYALQEERLLLKHISFLAKGVSFAYENEKEEEKLNQISKRVKELFTFLNYPSPYNKIYVEPFTEEETISLPLEEKKEEEIQAPIEKREDWEEERQLEEEKERQEKEEAGQRFVESIRYAHFLETRKRSSKRGNYISCTSIEEAISLQGGNVEIRAKVASFDFKLTKKGSYGGTILLYDATSGINARVYEGKSVDKEVLLNLKEDDYVEIKGGLELEEHTQEIQIYVHSLIKKDEPLRDDLEEEKRVELHLHTKMSAMDATADIDDYCRLASHMGMKAIAVTDHGVVQSYPAAQKAAAKYGLKMLYGIEFYMFDYPTYAYRPSNIPLLRGKYCVFDFETTGLSSTYDRPTEFGAVLVEDGVVRARFDTFINPEQKIPVFIQEKTHITDEMVKDAPKNKEALEKIEQFIGDATLVSHNATFDIGFLNAMREREGKGPIENPVIDTLALSHYLFPDAKGHRLGDLSKNLKLDFYDDKQAHRADFDAEALAHVWNAIVTILTKDKVNMTLEDLANLHSDSLSIFRHLRSQHCCAIAKNKEGLRDLYRLVSESHVTYLSSGAEPKIPRSELVKYRKNLLLGSACFNGEIFEIASRRRYQDLLEAVRFYDYIEIQPPANYSYRVNIGDFTSERILELLKTICKAAEEAGVMVCATGDCHYLNPEDKLSRDVLIASRSVGRGTHPLARGRSSANPFPNPDQHFRSTREMIECFSSFLPEEYVRKIVIENTNTIANLCDPLVILKDRLYSPTANLPGSDEKLREICYANLKAKYGDHLDPIIKERLDKELNGIISNGYSVTYYIAHLIIKKAHEDGYIVGSRGSVGSSFAATMANITEVNPLPPHYLCTKCKHLEWGVGVRSGFDLSEKRCPICGELMERDGQNIPFETFLGFNADKVPDIDLNFPKDYQSKAHAYARELLSSKEENELIAKNIPVTSPHVVRAGTISTTEEKNAIGYVKKEYIERFLGKDSSAFSRSYIRALAHRIVGVKRTTGQHPGGIVVIPKDMEIFDFTPFQHPADDPDASWLTTHFEFASMHDCLLKLDLLGHVDPLALRSLALRTKIPADEVPLTDEKVISLFRSPDALHLSSNPLGFKTGAIGLPEFGTDFVQRILIEALPSSFNDLLIISGISHGTDVWANNIQDIVREGVASLQEVIGCRDDIMTYLISMGVPSLDAFKIMESVRHGKGVNEAQERMMREHGVPEWYLTSCNKIRYLFPRAHATAYVINAVRNAWYKLYRPLDFYATYFSVRCEKFDITAMLSGLDAVSRAYQQLEARQHSSEAKNTDHDYMKSLQACAELYARGFKVDNISITRSLATDWAVDYQRKSVIPPFIVLNGLGEAVAQSVVDARNEAEFLSQEDLSERTLLSQEHLKQLEKLGALDGLNKSNQMSLFDFFPLE